MPHNASIVFHTDWTQNVTQSPQFQTYMPQYVGGIYVWAGHDYFGECCESLRFMPFPCQLLR